MDQLIYASFSHTHYWYAAGILNVPAYRCLGSVVLPFPSKHKWEAFIKTDLFLFALSPYDIGASLRGEGTTNGLQM